MDYLKCNKVENEAGYPCYVDETSGAQSYNHPKFSLILKTLEEYNDIKYSAYRIAFKIFAFQKNVQVPPLRISSGVFARHQLSLSESSLSLDTTELEAVLADIYFAAEKEGLFSGDVDLAVDLLINLLLNVYDEQRKTPIRVLAAKTLLILLSEESISDKWLALANCSADHNGCVSPKRLAALLAHVTALPKYLGCQCDYIQSDVESCFEKNAGMLGISAQAVADWGTNHCASTKWLTVVQRVTTSRNCSNASASCAACLQPLIQVLKFRCSKCNKLFFCEKCYLYDKDISKISGHKKTHLVLEVVDGEIKPAECLSFMKNMKRIFFCTKTKKKKTSKNRKSVKNFANQGSTRRKDRPAIFTSTVGKASGNKANPALTLQDVITQLENENKVIKELTDQLDTAAKTGSDELKSKVDQHYKQLSTQINRLKMLKDNLLSPQNLQGDTKTDATERPQEFDLFSPILVIDEKQSKVSENNQPRVLSMDSGNFSVTSKPDSQNLLTVSGDAIKPVVIHATSDSISSVSMNDMSHWYNETEPKRNQEPDRSIMATEQQFAADIESVESSNHKMRALNADLDTVLDRLQQILTHNFTMDDSCFDNTQLRETANEMEGLLGTLIRGVEQRATLNASKGLV